MVDYSKNRLLVLYRILLEYTDEEHPMTMRNILEKMDLMGYSCSEDSVLRYINQLRNEIGVDIVSTRGRCASYFIGTRVLEKEELQLLMDAINSSSVIGKSTSKNIIKKLKGLLSSYQAEELTRTVLTSKNTKRTNKRILYNINKIQDAFVKNVQIEFDYMDWTEEKKLSIVGKKRKINPWGLIWANGRYYLYGFTVEEEEDSISERTYRVDKIDQIDLLLETSRQGKKKFEDFDIQRYVSRRIDMFSGDEEYVTVRVPNKLIGAFIDQFGTDIDIKSNGEYVLISFYVAVTSIFFGWILGLQGTELVAPISVRNELVKYLKDNIEQYN